MRRKIVKIGSSIGVTLPKKEAEELGIDAGDEVTVSVDKKTREITMRPTHELTQRQQRIAELGVNFIERYRKDLEALAKK